MCQAGTGLRESCATRRALTFAPPAALAELPVLVPEGSGDRVLVPEGKETGPEGRRPVIVPTEGRRPVIVPTEGRRPVIVPEARGTGLGSGQCRRRARPGGRL